MQNQTINLPNAIALNEALLEQLKGLLGRLEGSLSKCYAKLEDNKRILDQLDQEVVITKEQSVPKPFYDKVLQAVQFAAAPYFKTPSGKCAPPNAEAIYRKNQKTIYPHDLNQFTRSQWTSGDKSLLLRLIKDAILDYSRLHLKEDVALTKSMTLSKIIDAVNEVPFQINWDRISDDLYNRHAAVECQAMWRLVLHPNLKRGKWTDAEDDALLETAREFKFQNWEKIAEAIETPRSMFQCFLRYQTCFMRFATQKTAKFSAEEDKQLVALVNEHKTGNIIPWTTIARSMTHRSKQTLYNRYVFSLRPNISKDKFSVEEDCIFLAAVQEYGLDFRKISAEFPNRTVVQLRSHYNNVLKRNSAVTPWTLEADLELVKLVDEGKTWAQIATVLKNYNRQTCRCRYQTISNFLAKNPGTEVKDVTRRKRVAVNGVTTENWSTKLTEVCSQLSVKKLSSTELVKLASFFKLFDVSMEEQLVDEYLKSFTKDEAAMLRTVPLQKKENLLDIPMHKPTLIGFDRLRSYLANTEEQKPPPPKTYSRVLTVERENFKKQFKALFYLPAILATLKPETANSTTIETPYGNIVVTY